MVILKRNNNGFSHHLLLALLVIIIITLVGVRVMISSQAADTRNISSNQILTTSQKSYLQSVATNTWNFYHEDVDPITNLPKNSVIPSSSSKNCNYTSGTEIGFYINSIVAARDLNIITANVAEQKVSLLLSTLQKMPTYRGFLYRWYDTSNAQVATSVGCAGSTTDGTSGSGSQGFVSSVDDAWYASSLVVAREAFPRLKAQFSSLLNAMNWGLLYNSTTNRMYAGYNIGQGPTPATYNLLYGGTRIALYMGIGTNTIPGNAFWSLQRVPASGQQTPVGNTVSYTDPQNKKSYSVYEGHYTYNNIQFVPTFAGSMFQALAPSLVVPETVWGTKGFAINDVNTALAQSKYTVRTLNYPVWGLAPSTTPGRVTGYAQYGAPGLATKTGAIPDNGITPYASFLALQVIPKQAYANIVALKNNYPKLTSGKYGFYDTVEPSTGRVALRYMDVSQGTILSSIDSAINGVGLQKYFIQDSVGQNIQPYISLENFNIVPSR